MLRLYTEWLGLIGPAAAHVNHVVVKDDADVDDEMAAHLDRPPLP